MKFVINTKDMSYTISPIHYESTIHLTRRMQQRGLTGKMIEAAISIGTALQKQGLDMIMVRDCDIPEKMDKSFASRIKGLVLIMSPDGAIITSYKNRKSGFKDLKKKSKRDLKKNVTRN